VNNELERMWKEAVVASFKALHFPVLRETRKALIQDSGRDLNPGPPEYEA
jgi:hypothetical protein